MNDEAWPPPKRGKWDAKKFAGRTPLSTVVNRTVRLVRAPAGSSAWKTGMLLVQDAESGETLGEVHPNGLHDPKTGWTLRIDC